MTNFIFKSHGTYKKLCQQLEIIQSELRAQRQDNIQILFLLNKLLTAKALQKQVDDYYGDGTSHQTDYDEQMESQKKAFEEQ